MDTLMSPIPNQGDPAVSCWHNMADHLHEAELYLIYSPVLAVNFGMHAQVRYHKIVMITPMTDEQAVTIICWRNFGLSNSMDVRNDQDIEQTV